MCKKLLENVKNKNSGWMKRSKREVDERSEKIP